MGWNSFVKAWRIGLKVETKLPYATRRPINIAEFLVILIIKDQLPKSCPI